MSAADPPLLILGGSVNALGVARSMARSGIEVHAVADALGRSPVRHCGYVCGYREVSDAASAQEEWLEWLPYGPRGAVVLPCGDPGVEFIAHHRSYLLELGYLPTEADDDVALAMLDKDLTYTWARKVGVETPVTMTTCSLGELADVAATFSFPCALKPLHSHRSSHRIGAKAVVANSAAEMARQLERLHSMDVDVLVTEIVPGPESAYCSYYSYLDVNGEPLVHFTKRKPRQYPVGFGWGCFHETAWEPDAAEIGLKFLQGVGVRGLAFVEFKRDARDGRLKLIECNPRLSAANELVRLAGIDLARLAYDRALGRLGPRSATFKEGLREWHPISDTRACFLLWRDRQLSLPSWAASIAPPVHLPIFDRHDLKPSFHNSLHYLRRLGRALASMAWPSAHRRI